MGRPGTWKPGQSGNPHGRPKNALSEEIRAALEKVRSVEVDGRKRKMTENQVLIRILLTKAREGDQKAIQMLWDRGYGKPTEDVHMSGELSGGGVIIVERANGIPDKTA